MRWTYAANIRRTYGEYTANSRLIYGEHTKDIRRTYDEHTVNMCQKLLRTYGGHAVNICQYHVSFPPNPYLSIAPRKFEIYIDIYAAY